MQLSNDDNFDFIMCTTTKSSFAFSHFISSHPLSLFHRTLSYTIIWIIFFATFSVVDGLLHFTIISRAKKKRMPHRHKTTLYNDIFYLYSLSLPFSFSFYLFLSSHLLLPSCSRTIFALSFKCSFSSIHSITHELLQTNTHIWTIAWKA